jgi:hypothetical protein
LVWRLGVPSSTVAAELEIDTGSLQISWQRSSKFIFSHRQRTLAKTGRESFYTDTKMYVSIFSRSGVWSNKVRTCTDRQMHTKKLLMCTHAQNVVEHQGGGTKVKCELDAVGRRRGRARRGRTGAGGRGRSWRRCTGGLVAAGTQRYRSWSCG